MRSCLVFACASLTLACTRAPKPTVSTRDAGDAATFPAPSATVGATRGPSAILRRHWTFGRDVPFALYADLSALMKTKVFAEITPIVLAREDLFRTAAQQDCWKSLFASGRELVAGGDGKRSLTLLRFEPSATAVSPGKCLSLTLELKGTTLAGAAEAYEDEDDLLVTTPGLLFYGTKDTVKTALAGNAADSGWPSTVELAENQYLSCHGTDGKNTSGSCELTITPERMRLSFRVDARDERSAKEGIEALEQVLAVTGANGPLRGFSYERKGSRVDIALEASGAAAEQAHQFGVTSTFLIQGTKTYLQQAKQGEARATVRRIAKAYVAAHARDSGGASQKKLTSFPAVPKAIPRGHKYQSAPGEWTAWEPIGFFMRTPQYYQYEVIVAPNGASAEIIARGDLDADSKPSKFTLRIKLENGTPKLAPQVEETAPDE